MMVGGWVQLPLFNFILLHGCILLDVLFSCILLASKQWSVYLLQAIDAKYAEVTATVGPDQEVMFEKEQITLDIPKEGLTLHSGWTITPHTHPGVSLCECTTRVRILTVCTVTFPTDHQTAGRQVCTWSSSAFLSAACGVEWAAEAACATGTQNGANWGKKSLRFFSDFTSCNTATITR